MGIKEQIYLLEIQIQDADLETVKELDCFDDKKNFKIYAHFLSFDPVLVFNNRDEEFKALPILFKMSPDELIKAIDRSALTLSVAGMLDEEREYTVGTVKVLFTESFAEAITLATNTVMFPVTSLLDEPFPFRNLYHEESGRIHISMKLSCFGYIDIKRLGTCEVQDQAKDINNHTDKNAFTDDFNDKDNTLKPVFTDLEHVQPAAVMTDRFEGVKDAVPWQMINDQKSEPPDADIRQFERPRLTAEIRDKDKNELTLECTCDSIPGFMTEKPAPQITLKCECASILAAMKSCFPNLQQDVAPDQQFDSTAKQRVSGPTVAQVDDSPDSRAQSTTHISKPISNTLLPQPPPPAAEIIPTSAVCGLELKNPGDEKDHAQQTSKQEIARNVTSEMAAVSPEKPESKIEDSLKKLKEDHDWDERKQVIKKEYKKKNKKVKDIYEYTAGMYPGMVIGHKYCIPTVRLVPRNMGWMWNLLDLFGAAQKSKGWRPGAIIKTVARNFGSWNRAAGFKDGDEAESFFNFKKKKNVKEVEQMKEAHMIKPTLHVHKKDKFYHITVNPPGGSNVKPLTFKVDPRKGSSDEETSSESTSDDSFEFEYTVPAGLIPPPRTIEWANETTQYNLQDFSSKKKVDTQAPVEEPPKEEKKPDAKGKGKKGRKGSKGSKKGKKGKGGKGKKK